MRASGRPSELTAGPESFARRAPVALALIAVAAAGLLGWFFLDESEPSPTAAPSAPRASEGSRPRGGEPQAQQPPTPSPHLSAPGAEPARSERPRASSPAASAAEAAPREESRVRLRVSDSAGQPLLASVTGLAGERLASGQGEVAVPAPPGEPVRVSAAGHVAQVLLLPAELAEVTLSRGRTLRGEVVAAEDGSPLAGARVEALEGLALSDPQGRFELTVPDGEPVEVLVTAAERPATRAAEASGILRVEVPRGLGVRGRVVRSDRRAPGVTRLLLVGGQQLHRSFPLESDPAGSFELSGGLAPGEQVMVFAWSEGGWQSARQPRWQSPEAQLEVLLEEPASLLLAQPGVLTPVHAWPGERARRAPALAHRSLAPGAYRLEVPGEDPQVVELRAGEERRLLAQPPAAPRSAQLRVRVVDEFGGPVVGARAEVHIGGEVIGADADEGGLAELGLPRAAADAPLTVSGRAPGRVPLPVVAPAGAREVELVLALSVSLDLQVSPPQPLEVTVFRGGASLARARTGSGGRLRLEGLPAGEVRVVLESPRGEEIERRVTLPLQAPLEVQVR